MSPSCRPAPTPWQPAAPAAPGPPAAWPAPASAVCAGGARSSCHRCLLRRPAAQAPAAQQPPRRVLSWPGCLPLVPAGGCLRPCCRGAGLLCRQCALRRGGARMTTPGWALPPPPGWRRPPGACGPRWCASRTHLCPHCYPQALLLQRLAGCLLLPQPPQAQHPSKHPGRAAWVSARLLAPQPADRCRCRCRHGCLPAHDRRQQRLSGRGSFAGSGGSAGWGLSATASALQASGSRCGRPGQPRRPPQMCCQFATAARQQPHGWRSLAGWGSCHCSPCAAPPAPAAQSWPRPRQLPRQRWSAAGSSAAAQWGSSGAVAAPAP